MHVASIQKRKCRKHTASHTFIWIHFIRKCHLTVLCLPIYDFIQMIRIAVVVVVQSVKQKKKKDAFDSISSGRALWTSNGLSCITSPRKTQNHSFLPANIKSINIGWIAIIKKNINTKLEIPWNFLAKMKSTNKKWNAFQFDILSFNYWNWVSYLTLWELSDWKDIFRLQFSLTWIRLNTNKLVLIYPKLHFENLLGHSRMHLNANYIFCW